MQLSIFRIHVGQLPLELGQLILMPMVLVVSLAPSGCIELTEAFGKHTSCTVAAPQKMVNVLYWDLFVMESKKENRFFGMIFWEFWICGK